MSTTKVISENVQAKYSDEGDAVEVSARGRYLVNGRWYHSTGSGGHFVEGQMIDGKVIEYETGGTDGRGNWKSYNVVGFEPDKKYSPPMYFYEFFENRRVDCKVLGNFTSDCKLCGEKNVVEYTHVMGECATKNKAKIKRIQKEKDLWFKNFHKESDKKWKERQKMIEKAKTKKHRFYEMKFNQKKSGWVGLTGPFKNKEEAIKGARKRDKKLKVKDIAIKFLGWKTGWN